MTTYVFDSLIHGRVQGPCRESYFLIRPMENNSDPIGDKAADTMNHLLFVYKKRKLSICAQGH